MNRGHIRVVALSAAIVLLLQNVPAIAEGRQDHNRPVEVTFEKWVTGPLFVPDNFGITQGRGLMQGVTGGDIPGRFVGEVIQGQLSANPALKGVVNKIEAIYEVQDPDGNLVFTALIRGGINGKSGAAVLDGTVLVGWRTGASVHVEFETVIGCDAAPTPATKCFVGTIRVGRAPNGSE